MSSGCGDVLSLEDLKTAKKHQTFEAEVITGRAGGVASGAEIDYATNQVTGQVQKTMPAILRDIGFRPASFDFVSGGTIGVNDRDLAVLWPLPGGDGDWYYWEGALPKVIPANSTPASTGGVADGAWRPVGDLTLRTELASSSGAGLIGYKEGGTLEDAITYLTPDMFGAVGDGVSDDRVPLQAAINRANQLYLATGSQCEVRLLAKTYIVSQNPASTAINGEVSAGFGCINMLSGVILQGPGTIKLKPGTSGANPGAIITNWTGPCVDSAIDRVSVDGNASNITATRMVGINLCNTTRVALTNLKVHNTLGIAGGIYMRRGGFSTSDYGCVESRIMNCDVYDIGYIGIQAERPDGIIISGNNVFNTGDNGIDIEGNNASGSSGFGRQMLIANNICRNNKNGIFIESCSNASITGNDISDVGGIGIVLNRINTGSFNNIVSNNKIAGLATQLAYGLRVINNSGGCTIASNHFTSLYSSIKFNGRATRVYVGANNHSAIANFLVELEATTGNLTALFRSYIAKQFYQGTQTSGVPAPLSPIGCPSNFPSRLNTSTYEDAHFSDLNGAGEVNFVYRTGNLTLNASWAAYARYNNTTTGYTDLNGNFGVVGDFLEISGIVYKIYAVTASTTTITKWDGSNYSSGNFVSDFTTAALVKTHRPTWGTL